MTALPAVLQVQDLGDGHYAAPHPENDPEQRGVVFSGQILAQMIMVSDLAVEHAKEAKSIHTIFARAGTTAQARSTTCVTRCTRAARGGATPSRSRRAIASCRAASCS